MNIITNLFNFCFSNQLQQNEDLQQEVKERTNLIPEESVSVGANFDIGIGDETSNAETKEEAKENGKLDATLVVIPER